MTRWIQTTPGAPGGIITRPTRAMMDLREVDNGVVRVNGDFTVQGTGDTTVTNSLVDVVSAASYGLPSGTTSSVVQTTAGDLTVLSGNRSGNPSSTRRGFALPASLIAGKSQVTLFAVNRVPDSTWTDHPTAATQAFVSYLVSNPAANGTTYGMRIRYTTTGAEVSARRAATDSTIITASISFDPDAWHALRVDLDYVAGSVTITELMSGTAATASGMSGSGAAAAAGGSDFVSLFYQFHSTGSAQAYYGLCADFIAYPFATGDQRNDALFYHADARIVAAEA